MYFLIELKTLGATQSFHKNFTHNIAFNIYITGDWLKTISMMRDLIKTFGVLHEW